MPSEGDWILSVIVMLLAICLWLIPVRFWFEAWEVCKELRGKGKASRAK